MTDAKIIRAIIRFFFYLLLDEAGAFAASTVALSAIQGKTGHLSATDDLRWPAVVAALRDSMQRISLAQQFGQPVVFSDQEWLLPPELDLGVWLEFRRRADSTELFVFLLIAVLGVSESAVAEGLGETVGTVRHRLARGLRRLGAIQSGQVGHERTV